MRYEEQLDFECPICGKKLKYIENVRGVLYDEQDKCVAVMSTDCHGIPFRTICEDCYENIMATKGYDGEYYTEADECIDYDY